jgi:hypothetical protein
LPTSAHNINLGQKKWPPVATISYRLCNYTLIIAATVTLNFIAPFDLSGWNHGRDGMLVDHLCHSILEQNCKLVK